MVFAREVSAPLTSLVKKFDAEAVKNGKMGTFVVFLGGDDTLNDKLKALGDKEGLKKCILSYVESPAGPEKYNVAKDADVTVLLYVKQKVVANYAFKKGELNAKAIEKIVADIPKILPTDK